MTERMKYLEQSQRVAELGQEYKSLLHQVRSSRLPLAPGNSIERRMLEIRRECWEKYNFDLRKYM